MEVANSHSYSDPIFTSEKRGCDETGDGTREKPYKTVKKGVRESLERSDDVVLYCDAKPAPEGETQEVIVEINESILCSTYVFAIVQLVYCDPLYYCFRNLK